MAPDALLRHAMIITIDFIHLRIIPNHFSRHISNLLVNELGFLSEILCHPLIVDVVPICHIGLKVNQQVNWLRYLQEAMSVAIT